MGIQNSLKGVLRSHLERLTIPHGDSKQAVLEPRIGVNTGLTVPHGDSEPEAQQVQAQDAHLTIPHGDSKPDTVRKAIKSRVLTIPHGDSKLDVVGNCDLISEAHYPPWGFKTSSVVPPVATVPVVSLSPMGIQNASRPGRGQSVPWTHYPPWGFKTTACLYSASARPPHYPPFTRVFSRRGSVEESGAVGPPRVWPGQARRGRLSAAV